MVRQKRGGFRKEIILARILGDEIWKLKNGEILLESTRSHCVYFASFKR